MISIHRAHLLAAAVAVAMSCGGCYNNDEVRAFLHKPRMHVAATEYRIYPPDVLAITSLHVPEIHNQLQQVRPDGKINLPLLGEIDVGGRTPKEVEALLTDVAHEYYDKVAATVEVRLFASQKFYVFGQVDQPGPYPWTGRDSLLDALSKAQPNRLSWPERILVVRGDDPIVGGADPNWTEEHSSYSSTGVREEKKDRPRRVMTVNLMAMIEKGDMSNNVLLLPNDVVYVQPNPLARLGLIIEQIFFPMNGAANSLEAFRTGADDIHWIKAGMPLDSSTNVNVR